MANTFEDQARDRFGKSSAFLNKAHTLMQDDLVARTVLADAVSAIKNSLQGYLLMKIGAAPPGTPTQHWQEVASSNRMPDLVNTCADAGLNVRDLARDIRRLNDERNYRTHDDPQRRIDAEQARRALDLARTVAQCVNAALRVGGGAVAAPRAALPVAGGSARTPLHNKMTAAPPSAVPAPSPGAAAAKPPMPAANGGAAATDDSPLAEDDEAPATTDDTGVYAAVGRTRRRGGRGQALTRGLLAAALVALGVVAGIGLSLPLAAGHAPSWLGFATQWYGTRPAGQSAPATATLTPSGGTLFSGALAIGAPACQAGKAAIALRNGGAASLQWAAAGAEAASGVAFALAPDAAPQAAASGTLAPGGAATLYATGPAGAAYRILVFGPGGVVPLVAPAC